MQSVILMFIVLYYIYFFQINRANSNDNESKLIIKTMLIFFQKTAVIKMQLQMYNFRVKIKRVLA